jgi:hypothetical protein
MGADHKVKPEQDLPYLPPNGRSEILYLGSECSQSKLLPSFLPPLRLDIVLPLIKLSVVDMVDLRSLNLRNDVAYVNAQLPTCEPSSPHTNHPTRGSSGAESW